LNSLSSTLQSMQSRRNQTPDSLGEFESLVLMAIIRLRNDAYGMRIHREIEERASRHCSFGALYTTLDRLERKGYVVSRMGEKTAERGGRAKKYFRITSAGSAAVRRAYRATLHMAQGLEPLLGGAL
jgi:PadR family transcriptional regulator, regulatory protein PadR